MAGKKVQEIPLRHERHELARGWNMTKIGHRKFRISNDNSQRDNFLMRQIQKLLQQPQLIQDLESGGMDSVPTKIAKEVSMLFEHSNLDASPRQ
jgi:hypothetical protein